MSAKKSILTSTLLIFIMSICTTAEATNWVTALNVNGYDGGWLTVKIDEDQVCDYTVYNMPEGSSGWSVNLGPGDIFIEWDDDPGHQSINYFNFNGNYSALSPTYVQVTGSYYTVYTVTSNGILTSPFGKHCCADHSAIHFDFSCCPVTLTKVDNVNDGNCVKPGDYITYTINYSYPPGPNCPDTNFFHIIDNLPAELTFNSASNGGYDAGSGKINWYLGGLHPGDAGSVTLTVQVNNPQPGGTITNSCEIRDIYGHILNTAYEYTPVCCNDLSVTLTKVDDVNDDNCIDPNREITYTIDYSYPAGPNCPNIIDVNIIDYLPAEVVFKSASVGGNYDPGPRRVSWYIGTLHPGTAGSVTLTVLTTNPQPGSTITNSCEIRNGGGQILKTAYEYTPVCCHPNFIKGVIYNNWKKITYQICYYANGCECNNVEFNDVLPYWVDFNSASGGGTYNSSTRAVTWNIGTLGAYDPCCVTLTVDINNHSKPGVASFIPYITNCCKMTGDCMDSAVTACVTTDFRLYPAHPPNWAADMNVQAVLGWKPGPLVLDCNDCNFTYPVYLGTNYNDVNDANTSSPVYKGEVDVNWYDPCGPLSYDTTYYWRIDQVIENYPDSPSWKGEIWQFTTICRKAHNPLPVNGATALSEPLQLSWTAGELAKSTGGHRVFFGTSFASVNVASITTTDGRYRGTVSSPVYPLTRLLENGPNPPGASFVLTPGVTYYWRIDEVNDPCVWKGPVWNFTPAAYVNIDDFEDYNSTDDVNVNWPDNYVLTGGGSPDITGNAGRGLIQDTNGKYLRYTYNNSSTAPGGMAFSEARRPYGGGTTFTGGGVISPAPKALRIDYLGAATNAVDPVYDRMYVAIEDTMGNVAVYQNPDGNAALVDNWTSWYAALTDINAAGAPLTVNLNAISGFAIGFGIRGNNWDFSGGEGNVMFDNIRLFASTCVPQFGPTADFDGDCTVDLDDLELMAYYWLTDCTPPRDCPTGQPMVDIYQDYIIDFKDLAILGNEWRTLILWP
jgi:hypothetical protein